MDISNIDVNNTILSESVQMKKGFKCLYGCLDDFIRSLILIMPKTSEYVTNFIDNKIFLYCDGELLEKYKNIWSKTDELKSVALTAFPVHDDKYIKSKIKTNSKKINTHFYDLIVPEDGIKCNCMTMISIDSLFIYREKIMCLFTSTFRWLQL